MSTLKDQVEALRSEWKTEPYGKATGTSFEEFLAAEIFIRDKKIERMYAINYLPHPEQRVPKTTHPKKLLL